MKLTSVYKDGERMSDRFANIGVEGGTNTSPGFTWEGAPAETKSFALTMIDHHPVAHDFVHWVVVDMFSTEVSIAEGASMTAGMPKGSIELKTSYGKPGYGGPRPPAGTGDHGYETTLYALSVASLGLNEDTGSAELAVRLKGKVLAAAKLTGIYSQ